MKGSSTNYKTYVTLISFCVLSKLPPSPNPGFQWKISSWVEYQSKSNEKYTRFYYIVFQILKLISIESYKIQVPVFVYCCFTSAFTSENIIFYNFLKLRSTLSKRYFRHKFPF